MRKEYQWTAGNSSYRAVMIQDGQLRYVIQRQQGPGGPGALVVSDPSVAYEMLRLATLVHGEPAP